MSSKNKQKKTKIIFEHAITDNSTPWNSIRQMYSHATSLNTDFQNHRSVCKKFFRKRKKNPNSNTTRDAHYCWFCHYQSVPVFSISYFFDRCSFFFKCCTPYTYFMNCHKWKQVFPHAIHIQTTTKRKEKTYTARHDVMYFIMSWNICFCWSHFTSSAGIIKIKSKRTLFTIFKTQINSISFYGKNGYLVCVCVCVGGTLIIVKRYFESLTSIFYFLFCFLQFEVFWW